MNRVDQEFRSRCDKGYLKYSVPAYFLGEQEDENRFSSIRLNSVDLRLR
jgi:hypothetical protein